VTFSRPLRAFDVHLRIVRTRSGAMLSIVTPHRLLRDSFQGRRPDEHGVKKYERPVLRCETLFDALIAAGKRVAIVAVRGSSIDLLFRERPIDHHSCDYDSVATASR
jgi:hypothetical protein